MTGITPEKEHNRISPFSCGTQYMDWEAANCLRCKKSVDVNDDVFVCDIQEALGLACIGDGYVTDDIARRMGYFDNNGKGSFAYCWKCNEVIWTETWIVEYFIKQIRKEKNDRGKTENKNN